MEKHKKKKRNITKPLGRPRLGTDKRVPVCVSIEQYVLDHIRDYAHEKGVKVSTLVQDIFLEYIDTHLQR